LKPFSAAVDPACSTEVRPGSIDHGLDALVLECFSRSLLMNWSAERRQHLFTGGG
jgi:hypothetical protein